jgi:hypothetical protein
MPFKPKKSKVLKAKKTHKNKKGSIKIEPFD